MSAHDPFNRALGRLWIAWAKHFERNRAGQFPARDAPDAEREVCRVLLETAEARGLDFDALVEMVLERYWRDPWPRAMANRAGFRNLLRQLVGILDEPSGDGDPADYDPARDGAPTDPRNFDAWNRHVSRSEGLAT